ncbi:hypothetical protein [Thermus sp. 93170]|uniref:hypothetical protein n=1 Tax=Thermus sp. 93170 TaxID=1046939 RepID=UPI003F42C412
MFSADIHRAHQAGATAQVKLDVAALVRGELSRAVSIQAQAHLSLGARLLVEAAEGVSSPGAKDLLRATASFLAQARVDIASGRPPHLVLAGQVGGSFSFPGTAQARDLAMRAVAELSASGKAKGVLPLVGRIASLSLEASASGVDFRAGVALPLAREVALRGGAKLGKNRQLELTLGFAGRLQLKLGG